MAATTPTTLVAATRPSSAANGRTSHAGGRSSTRGRRGGGSDGLRPGAGAVDGRRPARRSRRRSGPGERWRGRRRRAAARHHGAVQGPLPGLAHRRPGVVGLGVRPTRPGRARRGHQRSRAEQLGGGAQLGSVVDEEAAAAALDVAAEHRVAPERDHRRAARPRLGDDQPEALERRRVHERHRAGQRHVAEGVVGIGDDDHVVVLRRGHHHLAEQHELEG